MMVLHLARGGYDSKEHRFYVTSLTRTAMKNGYTRLAVTTTDNQRDVNEFRKAVGAEWAFLSLIPDRTVQKGSR